jgi:hypothetical protein
VDTPLNNEIKNSILGRRLKILWPLENATWHDCSDNVERENGCETVEKNTECYCSEDYCNSAPQKHIYFVLGILSLAVSFLKLPF